MSPGLSDAARIGARALALAPALLAAPRLAAACGGRRDRTGALTVGALAAAVLVNAFGGPGAAQLGSAVVALFIGAAITAAIPMLPDLVRAIFERVHDLAYLALAVLIIVAAAPALNAPVVLAAAAVFAVGVAVAAIVALAVKVDPVSALLGAGTRDAAIAGAFAMTVGGAAAAAVPLAYGAMAATLVVVLASRQRLRDQAVRSTIQP